MLFYLLAIIVQACSIVPHKAEKVDVADDAGKPMQVDVKWDEASKTCFLSFENNPGEVHVKLSW